MNSPTSESKILTPSPQESIQIQPVIPIRPFSLRPLQQLVRPTFKVITIRYGSGPSTNTQFDDTQFFDLFVSRWPDVGTTGLRWGIGPISYSLPQPVGMPEREPAGRSGERRSVPRHPGPAVGWIASTGHLFCLHASGSQTGHPAHVSTVLRLSTRPAHSLLRTGHHHHRPLPRFLAPHRQTHQTSHRDYAFRPFYEDDFKRCLDTCQAIPADDLTRRSDAASIPLRLVSEEIISSYFSQRGAATHE